MQPLMEEISDTDFMMHIYRLYQWDIFLTASVLELCNWTVFVNSDYGFVSVTLCDAISQKFG
jgi:hypothetical protein